MTGTLLQQRTLTRPAPAPLLPSSVAIVGSDSTIGGPGGSALNDKVVQVTTTPTTGQIPVATAVAAAFPSSSIVDTFPTIENPIAGGGGNWAGFPIFNAYGPGAVLSAGVATSGTPSAPASFVSQLGPFAEPDVFFQILSATGGGVDFIDVLLVTSLGAFTGYRLKVVQSSPLIALYTSAGTNIGNWTPALALTDWIGFRFVAGVLSVYHRTNVGSWALVGSVTDTSSAGPFYVAMVVDAQTSSFGSFAAGNATITESWAATTLSITPAAATSAAVGTSRLDYESNFPTKPTVLTDKTPPSDLLKNGSSLIPSRSGEYVTFEPKITRSPMNGGLASTDSEWGPISDTTDPTLLHRLSAIYAGGGHVSLQWFCSSDAITFAIAITDPTPDLTESGAIVTARTEAFWAAPGLFYRPRLVCTTTIPAGANNLYVCDERVPV